MAFLQLDKKIGSFFSSFNGQDIKKEREIIDKNKKKIIGFYGLQGGVGVSSLIYQLALNINKRILIFDTKLLSPYHYIYIKDKTRSSFQTYLFNELTAKKNTNSIELRNFIGTKGHISFLYVPPTTMMDYLTLTQNNRGFTIITSLIHELTSMYDVIFIDIDMTNIDNFIGQGILNQIDSLIEISVPSLACDLNRETLKDLINKEVLKKRIINKVTEEGTYKNELGLPYEQEYITNESYGENYLKSLGCSDNFRKKFNIITEVILNMIEGK